jgi:hypothetical protein
VERWEGFVVLLLAIIGLLAISLGDLLQLSKNWKFGVPIAIGIASAAIAIYLLVIALRPATSSATGDFEQLGQLIASNFRGSPRLGLFAALILSLALAIFAVARSWLARIHREQEFASSRFLG